MLHLGYLAVKIYSDKSNKQDIVVQIIIIMFDSWQEHADDV